MARRPSNRYRRQQDRLRTELLQGAHAEIDCRLRRTSPRGWGPWTDAIVNVGPLPDGAVSWHVDDPVAVGQPAKLKVVNADFVDIERVGLRPVRFRTEAFWGMDGDIIVLQAERATTELALPLEYSTPLYDRLHYQLVTRHQL